MEELQDFRGYLEHDSRAKHVRLHDPNKYDYIEKPKGTGYRGVHYVYGYTPSSAKNEPYRGLKVEVQLRTNTQHAWATAVEIADLVLGARTKFEDGSGPYGRFFRLASEVLARTSEGKNSCLPHLTNRDLRDQFRAEERDLQLLDRLGKLREQENLDNIKQHTVLSFRSDDTLEIFGYVDAFRAVKKEEELLDDDECDHVVYVRASTPASIRNSYRNYLTNPADFVNLMREGVASL